LNPFEIARDAVTAREVVEHYGFEINRAGFINCPFHLERTPSCKIYTKNFHCFGCGVGGDVIKFISLLHNELPIEAVKRINNDFRLGLPLDRQLTPEERKQYADENNRKKMYGEYIAEFDEWINSAYEVLAEFARMGRNIVLWALPVELSIEFQSLHAAVDYYFDELFLCESIRNNAEKRKQQANYYACAHKTIARMWEFYAKINAP
jgi:hypothetical protein